jgi:hypothetical protein
MTTETTYSFIYDRQSADTAFHSIAPEQLVLSMLAGIPPEAQWEGCLVYLGPSPIDGPTVCVGTRGPGADAVQLRLIEALERQAVRILEVYEGGPDPSAHVAIARAGRWSLP